eukprot:Em0004g73a
MDVPIPCLLCEQCFSDGKAREEFLRHMLYSHKIVVHGTHDISSWKCYAEYWKRRFSQAPLTEFAAVIRTNTQTTDTLQFPSEDFFLLCDSLPEDKQLRQRLQMRRLEAILRVQERERTATDGRWPCLFCTQVFSGNRALVFQHMLDVHSFSIGQPNNLVFVEEFLEVLRQKLSSLQCFYCEKTFKDMPTLKEHMRKKQHKRVNPSNHGYDKYYMVNYLELGKTWEQVLKEDDKEEEEEEKEEEVEGADLLKRNEWEDWQDSSAHEPIFCLFCKTLEVTFSAAVHHMAVAHDFDLPAICRLLQLDHYSQVKLVNYVRRQIYCHCCIHCLSHFESTNELLVHMTLCGHFKLPLNSSTWNNPQYLFPTYENDAMLCFLDMDSAEGNADSAEGNADRAEGNADQAEGNADRAEGKVGVVEGSVGGL